MEEEKTSEGKGIVAPEVSLDSYIDKTIESKNQKRNVVRIGEIFFDSYDLSTIDLANLVLQLLETEQIKSYLKTLETKRISGSMVD